MEAVWSPPVSAGVLERLRLTLRKSTPADGLGVHLRRRQGHSLEFREHRKYQMGDDIRNVDWLASARRPQLGPGDLLVRAFEAEERMVLAVVLDLRPGMLLPAAAPKLLMALWWMQCLVRIAVAQGDAVLVGTIFGPDDLRPRPLPGRNANSVAATMAARLWDGRQSMQDEGAPLAATQRLIRALEPAAAVVLISDMIFADPSDGVARLARAAQQSRRELLVVEIDSFAAEAAQPELGGPMLRAAFEGHPAAQLAGRVGQAELAQARAAMAALRVERRHLWQHGGMYWPDASVVPVPTTIAALRRQFSLDFPRHPVLRALIGRGGVA